MKTSIKHLSLGIVLLLGTLLLVIANKNMIVQQGGRTSLDIHIESGVKTDEIKTIIWDNSAFNSDEIKFEVSDEMITIETGYITDESIKSIEDLLSNKYKDKVFISSLNRLGEFKATPMLYVVYVIIAISLMISIYLIVKNLIRILKEKRS